MRASKINLLHAIISKKENDKSKKENDVTLWAPLERKRKLTELIAKHIAGLSKEDREDLEIAVIQIKKEGENKRQNMTL